MKYRRRFFQKFLDKIIKIPIFKCSYVLYDFLTISDEIDFKKKKREYELMDGVHKLKETKNLEGILYCKFNKTISSQQKVIKEYVNINEILLTKLTNNYSTLISDFERVHLTLKNISDTYKQLKDISDEFNDPFSITNTYCLLEKLNGELSSNYSKQINLIDTDLKEFFEYHRNEFDTLKENINIYGENKTEYLSYHNSLKRKKEKLFKTNDIQRFEINPEELQNIDEQSIKENRSVAFKMMCRPETVTVEEKRRKLGVCSFALINDFIKLRNTHSRSLRNHFIELSGKNNDLLADVFGMVKLLHMNTESEYKNQKIDKDDKNDPGKEYDSETQSEEKLNLDEIDSLLLYNRNTTICKKPKEKKSIDISQVDITNIPDNMNNDYFISDMSKNDFTFLNNEVVNYNTSNKKENLSIIDEIKNEENPETYYQDKVLEKDNNFDMKDSEY